MSRPYSRIVLWGWHHDSNKGDAAIVRGLLHHLRSDQRPLDVVLLANVREGNPALSSLLRYPVPAGVTATVIPSPLRVDRDDRGLRRMWRGVASLLELGLLLALPIRLLPPSLRQMVRVIKESDAVVAKGGHYLYARPGLGGLFAMLLSMAPMLVSLRYRRPVFLCGLTVGPFHGSIARHIIRWALSSCTAISVRDSASRDALIELGVPAAHLTVGTDLAFALPAQDERSAAARTLLVNLRGRDPERSGQDGEWRRSLAGLVQAVLAVRPDTRLLPLITAAAPESAAILADTASEDDREATRALFTDLGRDAGSMEGEDAVGPEALVGRISAASAAIAVRLHAGLLTLVAGRPCVLIDYTGTKAQVFRELGVGDWLTSVRALQDPVEHRRVVDLLVGFLDRPAESESRAKAALQEARTRLDEDPALRLLRRALGGQET